MTTTDRQDTIRRAIALIDTASPADLAGWLAGTRVHADLKASPAALRASIANGAAHPDVGPRFGAWKAAQQLLQAAGLPY